MIPAKALLAIIGGFIYTLGQSFFTTTGNLYPYIISFMEIKSSQVVWIASVLTSFMAISVPIGALLYRKIGFIAVGVIGFTLTAAGVMLCRITLFHGLGLVILTFSIITGIGTGIPYSVVYSVCPSWFPKNRGLAVGIISCGYSIGAVLFTPIQEFVINPKNLRYLPNTTKFPDEVQDNFPNVFLILGAMNIGLGIIAMSMIRDNSEAYYASRKEEESQFEFIYPMKEEIEENLVEASTINNTKKREFESLTVRQALCQIDFYLLFFIIFFDTVAIVILQSTYKLFGLQNRLDNKYLSAIGASASIFNCLGSLFWGWIVDKLSFKWPTLMMTLSTSIFTFTYPYVTGKYMVYLYAIWIYVFVFTSSGHYVIGPNAVVRIFGQKNMAPIYGLIYMATMPAALLTAAIISQFNIMGKWVAVYSSCGAFFLVSFLLGLFLRDEFAKAKATVNWFASPFDCCRAERKWNFDAKKVDEVSSVGE